jgi:hypothetical protein
LGFLTDWAALSSRWQYASDGQVGMMGKQGNGQVSSLNQICDENNIFE